MWLLAIISLGRWGTPTFLAFPDLPTPRAITRFNIVAGTIFWYFWRGIIGPQLTVKGNRTPSFYLFMRALSWRTVGILANVTLKKCYFGQKSGALIKMAF